MNPKNNKLKQEKGQARSVVRVSEGIERAGRRDISRGRIELGQEESETKDSWFGSEGWTGIGSCCND
jgi:hypothetical protein